MSDKPPSSAWLMVAVSSGACAAFNGVFAKLTTTELTSSFAGSIASAFGLEASDQFVEYIIRALFFGLNLLFNAIMWGLFTRALTLASSTVRVSIINTSANFIVTAVLSFLIFNESLPGLWWLGAALLVAGSVIIGKETDKKSVAAPARGEPLLDSSGDANGQDDDSEEGEHVELRSINESESEGSDDDGLLN